MIGQAYDLIVLGAGSGGLVSAELAAKMGARVALIDKEASAMGGESLYSRCVPSKSFIHAAKQPKATWRKVQKHLESVIEEIKEVRDNPEVYNELGVDTYFGSVKLQNGRRVKVGKETLTYKKLLISTGSTSRLPNIPGLKGVKYETTETIFSMKNMPRSLAIVGGGPMSVELAFAFRRLGADVHIIEHNARLLHKVDSEAAEWIDESLEDAGIHLHTSSSISMVKQKATRKEITLHHGDHTSIVRTGHILVAAGRKANIPSGLAKQEVLLENGAILVNDRWQTTNDSIYAVGGCTSFGQDFAHTASSAAAQAVNHALYGTKGRQGLCAPLYAFFTEPEVAQAGPTIEELDRSRIWHHIYQLPFTAVDKALADKEDGFIKVAVSRNGRLLSATIVGKNASELIGYFALAIDKKMKLIELANISFPYPTLSFGIKQLAYRAQLEALDDRKGLLRAVRKITLR